MAASPRMPVVDGEGSDVYVVGAATTLAGAIRVGARLYLGSGWKVTGAEVVTIWRDPMKTSPQDKSHDVWRLVTEEIGG